MSEARTSLRPAAPMLLMPPLPAPPALQAPAPAPFRALYGWGYLGSEGEGQGTLAVLIEAATGKVVLELHGLGERLVLLTGDAASGYRVQVPRQKLDATAPTLADLPLPFLPQVGSAEALKALLTEGRGTGVTVTKRGAQGPLKLHYVGKDPKGREEQVWLTWKER
ncbi:MAG TPA: hypothetical protein VJ570_03715 [Holophagaceae bacterium]|nr:hypothetical protein [Holophagaceae bacterium]